MELGVLGPLSVKIDNKIRTPTAPKIRTVLAALLVHADQVVPVSSLMRELWDEEPPVSGPTTLQTYILNLRKLFASATGLSPSAVAEEILVTRAGGYMFQPSSSSRLDEREFHRLFAEGRMALSAGDDQGAVCRLTAAQQIWRGPALVDVTAGRILEARRQQLEESRLVVLEYLVDAKLRLGMFREVLSELASMTVENPYHEGLHGQYMRALYLNGRRVQALQVFHRIRASLVDHLGLEPGPSMQELHRAILNAEPDVELGLDPHRPVGDIMRTATTGGSRLY